MKHAILPISYSRIFCRQDSSVTWVSLNIYYMPDEMPVDEAVDDDEDADTDVFFLAEYQQHNARRQPRIWELEYPKLLVDEGP